MPLRTLLVCSLLALIHCKAAGPSAGDAAAHPADAVSPTTPSAPAPDATAHLDSLAVCNLVVGAKIAQECDRKPAPAAGADASQFTAAGKPPRYGGVFTYATAAGYEAELAKMKTELAREKAPVPALFSNSNARTIVIAQGAFPAADLDSLKSIVAGLH